MTDQQSAAMGTFGTSINQGGNMFGSNNQGFGTMATNNNSSFGQTQGNLFNNMNSQSQPNSIFGQQSTGNMLGQTQGQGQGANNNLFGMGGQGLNNTPPSSIFGGGTGSSIFGPSNTGNTTNQFTSPLQQSNLQNTINTGNKLAVGLFQQTTTTTSPANTGTLFGGSTQSTGLFNTPTPAPQTGGLFPQSTTTSTTPQSSLFGNLANSTSSLFTQPNQPAATPPPQTGSLFGGSSLFGATTSASVGGGLFPNTSPANILNFSALQSAISSDVSLFAQNQNLTSLSSSINPLFPTTNLQSTSNPLFQ